MKRNTFITIALLILNSAVFGDSPLTSTAISEAYQNVTITGNNSNK